jgi:D-tyrosyl-tRNA(Tyr) deacylase
MRIVLQRVGHASVSIDGNVKSCIGKGLLLLLGIEATDTDEDINWLVKKILNMRIFEDENNVMNISALDICAGILVVSQFTLYASCKKGNRPSYIRAAGHDISVPLYNKFCQVMEKECPGKFGSGEFGADMKVELLNDGPVTIFLDSKIKE